MPVHVSDLKIELLDHDLHDHFDKAGSRGDLLDFLEGRRVDRGASEEAEPGGGMIAEVALSSETNVRRGNINSCS